MAISADALTDLLASRVPEVPREALAAMARAVIEMCDEARAEGVASERAACAKLCRDLADGPNLDTFEAAHYEFVAEEIEKRNGN